MVGEASKRKGSKPALLFVSMIGEPGRYDPAIFAEVDGGDDEVYWFRSMLDKNGLLDAVDFTGVHVTRGDPLPNAEDFDAIIIGGSFHSVHDGRPWQAMLKDWLQAPRKNQKPVFGICGGHQLMASMDGASVDKIPKGPMASTRSVSLTNAGRGHFLFDGLEDQPSFHFGNYECVKNPPEGFTVLAADEFMPAMALDHGGNWYSVQFHPEADDKAFAASWGDEEEGDFSDKYVPTPQAPRIFWNFLTGTGVLKS